MPTQGRVDHRLRVSVKEYSKHASRMKRACKRQLHGQRTSRGRRNRAYTARKGTRRSQESTRTASADSIGQGGSRGCTKASLQRRTSGGAGSRTRQGGTERFICAKREASDEQAQREPCSQVEEPYRNLTDRCHIALSSPTVQKSN